MVAETINSFRDLRVWRDGMDLVERVYRMTVAFLSQETYGLTSQLRRAAVSIPSNIAEGHTREHTGEYLQHISVAQGSLAELETQVELAGRFGYLAQEQLVQVLTRIAALRRQLYALRNALQERKGEQPACKSGSPPTPGP